MSTFHPIVPRYRDPQLEVCENLDEITWRVKKLKINKSEIRDCPWDYQLQTMQHSLMSNIYFFILTIFKWI